MNKKLIFVALVAILGTAIATTFNTERGKSTKAPGWYGFFLQDEERTPEELQAYHETNGHPSRYRRNGARKSN